MAYDVTLVQVNASLGGFSQVNTAMGFPPGTPFDTLLFSYWTCLPTGAFGTTSSGGPQYIFFLGINAQGNSTHVTLGNTNTDIQFYDAILTGAPPNVRANHLISVNCHTQTLQYYVNDVEQSVISGGWTASDQFDVPPLGNIWDFDVGSSFGQIFPAFADLWCGATTGFVDLSIEANRRKFINADLSPVFLGNDGSTPFGVAPQIYQTILPGGVPDDFLINRGSGISFNKGGNTTLTFQTPGTCHLPSIVQIPLTGVSATAEVGEFPQFHELKLVSLYPILPSSGDAYGLISDFGADFPANFSQFSLSVWCCEDVNIRGPNSYTMPFSFDMKFTPSAATLQLYDSLNQVLFSGSFTNPHTPTDLYHVMFSIDTQAQTYALWIASGAAAIEWTTSDANFATVGGINNVGA